VRKQVTGAFISGAQRSLLVAAAAVAAAGHSPAAAQEKGTITPFTLGTIVAVGQKPHVGEVGENQVSSVVTRNDMRKFNRDTVGDALNLLSGVTL